MSAPPEVSAPQAGGAAATTRAPDARRWILGAVVVGIALRLPWLARPLGSDEAGAVLAARSWASGGRLYTDLFVDRPQGFVLPFLALDHLVGTGTAAVRFLAIAAGTATVVGAAATARWVSGRVAPAVAAAWLAAVLGASAAIEGYAANGELLAGACSVPAMAVAASVAARQRPARWMVLAGVLGGSAATVKQSGADALVAIGLWCVLAGALRWRARRDALAQLLWCALGAALPLALSALHGATLGWHRYAYAVLLFRLHARSALAGPQLTRLAATLLVAATVLGPPTWVAVARLRRHLTALRRRLRPEHALVLCWAGVALLAFAAGGNYHRHYWVQLALPAAVSLALAIGAAAGPATAPPDLTQVLVLLRRALVVPLAASLLLVVAPGLERDHRLDQDRALVAWARAHRPADRRDLLPLCGEATWYVVADATPRYPYLWVDHVRAAQGARDDLVHLLGSRDAPGLVALYQPTSACDPDGRIRAALRQSYRRAAVVDGVVVLERVSAPGRRAAGGR